MEKRGSALAGPMIYAFADFELDTRRCELRRGGEAAHVEPQVYAVLLHLLENRDRLVPKEELLDQVWGHRFVTPATLNSRIKALRRALGDDGRAQRVVRTMRGRGFRFVAEVTATSPQDPSTTQVTDSSANEPLGGHPSPAGAPAKAHAPPRQTPDHQGRINQRIGFCHATDGVRIAYATSGGGPPLVKTANWLTHLEYDWNSPVWRHWLTEFSRDLTLIRYDERGCGLSDLNVEDLSFEAWVRDLETVVDALGLERFPLFGISQGGAVATVYAARHPERVSRLILYGGFPLGRLKRARSAAELAEAETMINIMPTGWGRDNPAFRQFFATIFLPEGTPEQMRWFCDLQLVSTTAENAVRLRTSSGGIDICDLARQVKAPTLVLHANGDAAVPFQQGCMLAALIPGARFVPLESRNHILLESEPAWSRFLQETRGFLELDPPSAEPPVR